MCRKKLKCEERNEKLNEEKIDPYIIEYKGARAKSNNDKTDECQKSGMKGKTESEHRVIEMQY